MQTDHPQLGFGLGLRTPHYEHFLKNRPKSVDWLEIISENYIHAHEGYWKMLADLRHDYAFVMHGVSMSIGSTDPLDEEYLKSLKKLADYIEVAWVSDHLCFTGVEKQNTHDLLPIPYTDEALAHLIPRIHKVQEVLGREMVFENASSYLEFSSSTIDEPEFFAQLHEKTGCKVLLDVNNVHVSCTNHRWNAKGYIDSMPAQAIAQYHLAGHSDRGNYLFDTHDQPVTNEVWALFDYALKQKGMRSTMIEWDANIPEFNILEDELLRAKAHVKSYEKKISHHAA